MFLETGVGGKDLDLAPYHGAPTAISARDGGRRDGTRERPRAPYLGR